MKRLEVIAQMEHVFARDRYSPRTKECYVDWLNRFWSFSLANCPALPLGGKVVLFVAPSSLTYAPQPAAPTVANA